MDIGPPDIIEMLADRDVWLKNRTRKGLWRARVVSVQDPEARGRIQVRILQLHPPTAPIGTSQNFDAGSASARSFVSPPGQGVPDAECPWAEPAFPFGGNANEGHIMLPSVGSTVWVGFDQGYTGQPVWLGGWLGQGELPIEFTDPANIRLIKTPVGHLLLFDDTPNNKRLIIASSDQSSGARLRLLEINDTTQTITLSNGPSATASKLVLTPTQITLQQGSTTQVIATATQMTLQRGTTTLVLDATGNVTLTNPINTIINTTGLVTLGVGAALGVMLDSFISLYNSHTHNENGTGGGVTNPPNQLGVLGTHSSSTVRAKV